VTGVVGPLMGVRYPPYDYNQRLRTCASKSESSSANLSPKYTETSPWWPPIVSSREMQHALGAAGTLLKQSITCEDRRE